MCTYIGAYRKRKISSTSPFDNFRDYREEARIRESGETSSYSSKKRNLNDLFRPPIDLIHHGDFESARQRCRTEQKWLLVNLQDMKEFSCQVLNRDVWSNDIVRDIIKESFVFWQVYHDSEEGYRYARLYNVSSYPHIAIIDPRTGGKLLSLSKTEASTFCTTVTRFLSENPMIESPSKNRSKRKTNIIDHSEESQLEAAIAASIQESCVNHKTSEKVEETVILDSDSDVILSKSDDDFNESDSCEEDIGIKNEIRKPSIESEKSISEVMVINSVVRETDEVDLTRSKDQLLPEYTHTNPIKFLLRFPNGERRYASFQASATVKELLKFVSDQGYDMREYELITAFPRRNVSSFPLNSSLVNNGLQGNDTIFVQMK
ncbi:uncharacterized protein TRIADDRAFT_55957 [Trichoplax adhaerens]|uniref:UBX domain-containing protein n=1 Tax=Trichoplax adhaerens TaxID=10228 RepID=B3RTK5_TRIAD|nr:hypothetical protein TRIADDRAFT_55957 [Trichoplax adhaerens]EDV25648.1 hypothetical protein TRIADDRAFT_55957 [Trichoplax adhaerens]|eukprot:XP_002111681.1 hypothetical protein TRIADDRAFT_55957 [Trichoplax adhaerens]